MDRAPPAAAVVNPGPPTERGGGTHTARQRHGLLHAHVVSEAQSLRCQRQQTALALNTHFLDNLLYFRAVKRKR